MFNLTNDVLFVWINNLAHDGSVTGILAEINCTYKMTRELHVLTEQLGKDPKPRSAFTNWQAMELDPVTQEVYHTLIALWG